jgi:hypothetical protein
MLAGLRTSIQTRHGPVETMPLPRACTHGRTRSATFDNVLVNQDARFGLARQARQRRLSVQEWEIAQILAVRLDQVEGVEDRGSSGLTTTQLLEP